MTITAAIVENYDSGQTLNYLVMWDASVLVASCPILIESVNSGDVAVSVSPDGRYSCFSDGIKTIVLEARTSVSVSLPFTLHGLDYAPFATGYAFGPKFGVDGYIYDADFSRRARIGVWAIEVLPPLPGISAPSFIEYEPSTNRIWVSYSRPVEHGALIKCFDLNSRREVTLFGQLAKYSEGSHEHSYYGRVMISPDGQYLHVYFRATDFAEGLEEYDRRIYSVRGGDPMYLPPAAFPEVSLFAGYAFGRGKFAYYQWLSIEVGSSRFEARSTLLDLNDGVTVSRSFGEAPSFGLSLPSSPSNYDAIDGQSFAAMGGYYKWNERNARAVSLATGDIVAAPHCFDSESFPPGATYSFITAIASQPRYWDAPRDGIFWTKKVYTAEIE